MNLGLLISWNILRIEILLVLPLIVSSNNNHILAFICIAIPFKLYLFLPLLMIYLCSRMHELCLQFKVLQTYLCGDSIEALYQFKQKIPPCNLRQYNSGYHFDVFLTSISMEITWQIVEFCDAYTMLNSARRIKDLKWNYGQHNTAPQKTAY